MGFSKSIGLGLITVAVLVGIASVIGKSDNSPKPTEPVTVWELVKVNDGGEMKYGLRYCTDGRCNWTGYRWQLDDLENATETWSYFAHPKPDPTVLEVIKHD
jgi:hypothetical protein